LELKTSKIKQSGADAFYPSLEGKSQKTRSLLKTGELLPVLRTQFLPTIKSGIPIPQENKGL
jgi:hypothetical protein